MELLKILPKNALSRTVGDLVSIENPKWLALKARDWFIKRYNINVSEAELPLEQYPSISKLFTRKLKPGIRPLGDGIVHPCDGKLTQANLIESDTLIQAKGFHYSLEKLIETKGCLSEFLGGMTLTYYLCPTDYHRVHSPIEGELYEVVHAPGALWPVNDWSVNSIKELFTVNERVIFKFKTPLGPVALVMVGATNVGKISVSFDEEIVTNKRGQSKVPFQKSYNPHKIIQKGQELGIFHMGSTVVMLYGPKMVNVVPRLGSVKLGESV